MYAKRALLAAGFVAVLVVSARSAAADPIYWSPESGGNGHYYGVVAAGSWTSAEAYAVSQGGHLVTIDDQAENDFLAATFLSGSGINQDFWIGYYSPSGDWTDASTWMWVSGSTSTFSNWRLGQPDGGYADGEDDRYAVINYPGGGEGRWDNYPNSVFRLPQGIYELDAAPVPEPASIVLLAACGAGWVSHRRLRRRAGRS